MSALKWTYKKPTKPGFYFWRFNTLCAANVVIIEISMGVGSKKILFRGGDSGNGEVKEIPGQWAGPIKEPK